jgi:hypothetical protein
MVRGGFPSRVTRVVAQIFMLLPLFFHGPILPSNVLALPVFLLNTAGEAPAAQALLVGTVHE